MTLSPHYRRLQCQLPFVAHAATSSHRPLGWLLTRTPPSTPPPPAAAAPWVLRAKCTDIDSQLLRTVNGLNGNLHVKGFDERAALGESVWLGELLDN